MTAQPVLDDLDSSPGSTTSLLRTIIGTSLRRLGGWIAVADLVELARAVGLPEPRTRTALSRVKAKGLLLPQHRGTVPGYALAAEALPMLERGDRRIYHPRGMTEGDRWCLISYSVPEANRDLRHQLRRRLSWIGCGSVSPALWICPEYLSDEVEEALAELRLGPNATLFLADEVRGVTDLSDAVRRWWNLDALRARHEAFLTAHAEEIRAPGVIASPERAYAVCIRGLDTWRVIPYLDPGLPGSLLPDDWPGKRSVPLFLELRDRLLPHANAHVEQVIGRSCAAQDRVS